ncbi:cupin domain-containing protein [bacterium]|nr:cupin domain-containing protein [bacterium]MCI7792740.1 cupin domain-containing protein [bacterium]
MNTNSSSELRDYGPAPYVVNIDRITKANPNYRTALWTGDYLQLTLMSIPVGGEIGLEVHPETDQFIRVESGLALAEMGDSKDHLTQKQRMDSRYAVIVPAGTWHNVTNIGSEPLKVYTLYAPPHHPHGTVQQTKAIADAQEHA